MKVIIVGAGMGGLIAAMSLQARGIAVEVLLPLAERQDIVREYKTAAGYLAAPLPQSLAGP